MKLGITFGALAPKVAGQLKKQKLTAAPLDIERAQANADAVTRLLIRGVLSDSEARKARQRILKRLLANVKPM